MRTPGLLGATVLAALVLPGVAAADVVPMPTPTLEAAGGKVKKYGLGLSAGPNNAYVYLSRSSHGSTQTHALFVNLASEVTYSAQANLTSAKLKVKFGDRGQISMRFKATGRAHKLLPKGCIGKASKGRTGVLKGTLRVRLDKGYFRTVKRTRMTATLIEPGAYQCGPGGGFGGGGKNAVSMNVGVQRLGQLSGTFARFGTHGKVFENVGVTTLGTGYQLTHTIVVERAKSSSISVGRGLKTGKVKGAGPFLAGTAKFKAVGTPGPNNAQGKVTGNFVAKFDSIGKRRFSSKQSVNLTKT